MQQQLTLSNGLQVQLISDPAASRAAALFELAAGSHHEPARWPGLAHLLEHVVFAGSQNFRDDERLMAWAQRQGARLNATTQPTSTGWFFDIDAPQLEAGLARLSDMLAQPLLSPQAIMQEVAVIDAEYQLLASDAATLREAASSAAFATPAALKAFHIGDRARFGEDSAALQQALAAYHQRYFHAGNLRLWLQGPQPLSELAQLAERYASGFHPDGCRAVRPEALSLHDERHFTLQAPAPERLLLSFVLKGIDREALALFQQFARDRAAGSLLATLGERGLCDDLQLSQPYHSDADSILCIEFLLSGAGQGECAQVEGHFFSWLRQLRGVTARQRAHYAGLAARQFTQLAPMDQLRARAFGFPPPSADPDSWLPLTAQLDQNRVSRLWVTPQQQAARCQRQGFTLPLQASRWPACHPPGQPQWRFYPLDRRAALPDFPAEQRPLAQFEAGQSPAVLIISPASGSVLPLRWGHIMQASLRAIIAQCAHAGGQLSFQWLEGQWLLQLSGQPEVILQTLDAALHQLAQIADAQQAQGERQWRQQQQQFQSDIALRCLLNQLPLIITGADRSQPTASLPRLRWQAALYGGDAELRQGISQLLSRWPGEINSDGEPAAAPQPTQSCWRIPTDSQEAAVVLFCPLVEQTSVCLAAWRVMASLFEPRFFQQMRVEKNLGYAVSCRFHRVAGENGLLFALQSPHYDTASIDRFIGEFIAEMAQTEFDRDVIAEQCGLLRESLERQPADRQEASRQQWLSQQSYAPALTAQAIARLDAASVRSYCQAMLEQPQRWWRLTNG